MRIELSVTTDERTLGSEVFVTMGVERYQVFERLLAYRNDTSTTVVFLEIAVDEAWYLHPNRSILPIGNAVIAPPLPVGRFVVVRIGEDSYQISLPDAGRLEVELTSGVVNLRCVVQGKRHCGFGGFLNENLPLATAKSRFRICVNRIESPEGCCWVEPYPWGAPAAICLTDHPDFDNVQNGEELCNALLRYDIRLTKGVFPKGRSSDGRHEAGLDCESYLQQIRMLHSQGSEVAYHGFGPERGCPKYEQCEDRVAVMNEFDSKTWIDHGTGDYLVSRGGKVPNGELTLDYLTQRGVRNFWSYHDVWDNPFTNIDSFLRRSSANLPAQVLGGLSVVSGSFQRPDRFLYQFAHAIKNVLGNPGYCDLRKSPLSVMQSRFWESVRRVAEVGAAPLLLFDENNCALSETTENAFFDTILLSHLAAQLRPEVVERLCEDSGLLLAHVYLSATLPHIASNALDDTGCVSLEFDHCLSHISHLQKQLKLITLSFSQLRVCLESIGRIIVMRESDRWAIRNDAESVGYVGFPRRVAGDVKGNDNGSCYIVEVPAKTIVYVQS